MTVPGPAEFHGGTARNPSGQWIGMNDRYLTLSGKPWLPVMGEFHLTRVPENEWEPEILKMKAAGVQIVAAYVIWIHHEEVQGQFDWEGRHNLRRFVELCAKHGMYVYPRIGPWAHGEARNGGFPDWLLKRTSKPRSTDPVYLSYVRTWYDQIGEQLKGLLWKDGGPVIGIQLENEYGMRGPGEGEAYILRLKQLAIDAGLDVPIYSVTGWDNAVVPKGEVVAVFGGYPDAPWDSSLEELPPSEVYAFRFGNRVSADMGAIGSAKVAVNETGPQFPFITAEMGGGVQDTYHRRPVIAPDDVAAMMPVMLGSGVNLYGTYMFQGGENPQGKLTTLQESQATGYPTDVPVKSYDFQAPLSQFGEERNVFRKLKVFNYFLNDFGMELAPMVPFAPARIPKDSQDFSVARVSVRTNGRGGFLFFNNYVRGYAMPDRPAFQVRVKLPDREFEIPEKPVDLPSGTYGIWPFEIQLGPIRLHYATAEIFTRIQTGSEETYYFVTSRGVPPEFVFEVADKTTIVTRGHETRREDGVHITGITPSLDPAIEVSDHGGQKMRIVLLSQEQAEDTWKLGGDTGHLLITRAQFYSYGQVVTLQNEGKPEFKFVITPPTAKPVADSAPIAETGHSDFAAEFSATLPAVKPELKIEKMKEAGHVPAVKIGPALSWRPHGVAMAPEGSEFSSAAEWKIRVPTGDWLGVSNLFLQVHYDGDVARLAAGSDLLDDDFYNGQPWRVGLGRYRSRLGKEGLTLEILPRRADAPIYLEKRFRDPTLISGQRVILKSAELVPQYELKFTLGSER